MGFRKIVTLVGIMLTCGMGFNNQGYAVPVSEASPAQEALQPKPERMDGPGMVNPNVWKHQRLDGLWMAPEGDIDCRISGFDYDLGIYKDDEPEHFCRHKNSFYFPGPMDCPPGKERIDLLLNAPTVVKDSAGNVIAQIEQMWEIKGTLYIKVLYASREVAQIRQLRNPKTFEE